MAHDVFISYSGKDEKLCKKMAKVLEQAGIDCWYASRDILPGQVWSDKITEAVENCKVLLLILTENSNVSEQCLSEASLALSLNKKIIPFKILEGEPSKALRYVISTFNWMDASNGDPSLYFSPLIDRVREIIDEPPPPPPPMPSWLKALCTILIIGILLSVAYYAYNGNSWDTTLLKEKYTELKYKISPTPAPEGMQYLAAGELPDEEYIIPVTDFYALSDDVLDSLECIRIVGNAVILEENEYYWGVYDSYQGQAVIDTSAGERYFCGLGNLQNLNFIVQRCKNLRSLSVFGNPLNSIEGINNLEKLEGLEIGGVELDAISEVYTLSNLYRLSVGESGIESLDGIENLKMLDTLSVSDSGIKDLSPLWNVDFSVAEAGPGFSLAIRNFAGDDYTPLNAIRKFNYLSTDDFDILPFVRNKGLKYLDVNGTELRTEQLAEICEVLPELEILEMRDCRTCDSLEVLTTMPNLNRVYVSSDMKKAIDSLEGLDYSFELVIR